jgi:hypothetical protein
MKDVPVDPEEEHLIVERYEDDFSEFHDTKNRQHGWVHPSGAHMTINDLGNIFLWLIKLLTVHNGDDTIILKIDPEKQQVDFYQKGKLNSETDDDVNIKIHKTLTILVDMAVNKTFNDVLTEKVEKDVSQTYNANHKTTTKGNREETVTGNEKHKSANTDIESNAPVGIKGMSTQLGGDVLQPYWQSEMDTWSQYPVIIPSVPFPPGSPVPPAPPLINMALNGFIAKIKEMDTAAKMAGGKALK